MVGTWILNYGHPFELLEYKPKINKPILSTFSVNLLKEMTDDNVISSKSNALEEMEYNIL